MTFVMQGVWVMHVGITKGLSVVLQQYYYQGLNLRLLDTLRLEVLFTF